MEDNFYKASSERLFPKSDKIRSRINTSKILYEKEAPIVSGVIAELEQAVKFYKSVDSIKETRDPENFMREVAVNKQVAEILDSKLKWLKSVKEVYGKEKKK